MFSGAIGFGCCLDSIGVYEINIKAGKIIDELDKHEIAAEHHGGPMIDVFYKRYGETVMDSFSIRNCNVMDLLAHVRKMMDK